MHTDLFIAVGAGLGGMIGWGLADFFAKKTIDEIGDTVTLIVAHIFGAITVVLVALYHIYVQGGTLAVPPSLDAFVILAFFGVLQAAVYLFLYSGFGKGQVAVLNPIFSSFSAITAVLSIVFFGEVVTGHIVIALIIVFVGVILMTADFGALRAHHFNVVVPGFREVAIATVLAAFWTLFWNVFVSGGDWLSDVLIMYLFMAAALLIYAYVKGISLRVTNPAMWKYLALIGFTETIAFVAISWGYGATQSTSVVAVLSGASTLPTVILARLFLREKTTTMQAAGTFVIVAGVALLSLV